MGKRSSLRFLNYYTDTAHSVWQTGRGQAENHQQYVSI